MKHKCITMVSRKFGSEGHLFDSDINFMKSHKISKLILNISGDIKKITEGGAICTSLHKTYPDTGATNFVCIFKTESALTPLEITMSSAYPEFWNEPGMFPQFIISLKSVDVGALWKWVM